MTMPPEQTSGASGSRPPSRSSNAGNTGTWSSHASAGPVQTHHRSNSRSQSVSQSQSQSYSHPPQHTSSRRSLSQVSVPISALISPHAPSIQSTQHRPQYHMRDPRKPNKIQPTPWSLSLGSFSRIWTKGWRGWMAEGGSPFHAWAFFLGFVLFPTWWIASFVGVQKTRTLGDDGEKAGHRNGQGTEGGQVVLDDPQAEFGR